MKRLAYIAALLALVAAASEWPSAQSAAPQKPADAKPAAAADAADLAEVAPNDDAPPTREELEAKARELGVKFNGRTSDKALAAKIQSTLEQA